MTDPFERNPSIASGYVQHGYAPWAPAGLVRDTSRSGFASLCLGVIGLVLAITSTWTFLAWVALLIGICLGSTAWLMPGATTARKVLSAVGIAFALLAGVLLLG